jgi:rsbT antagonist protein RsbS
MPLRVPLLRLGSTLIASIQDALSDEALRKLQSRILGEVVQSKVKGVIIDVSALDVLDSFGTRILCDIAAGIQLRGARAVIVGIQPEVAYAMVLLGLTMGDVETALDLDVGLEILERRVPVC